MLLDTHILLSILGQTDLLLPANIINLLKLPEQRSASVASIWEIAIKLRTGKLALSIDLNGISDLLESIGIQILHVRSSHALATIGPEPISKDPFDRLLLGVCAAEGMKLLTIDKALVSHPLAWRERILK